MIETSYKVIWKHSQAYAVEITEPVGTRRTVSPFKREEDAQAWIAEAKWNDALGAGKGGSPAPRKPR